jgi:hypothetical protein
MDYVCPVCNKSMPRDILDIISHTDKHIIDRIKKKHPAWVEKDGICTKCFDYYKKQLHPD